METKYCEICGEELKPIIARKVIDLTYSDSNRVKYVVNFPIELWSSMVYQCANCKSPCRVPIEFDDSEVVTS